MSKKKKAKINPQIKENIVLVLNEAIEALKKKDALQLRDISDKTIHSASIFQDKESITTAVLIYALFKISERHDQLDPMIIDLLVKAKNQLDYGNVQEYNKLTKKLIRNMSKIDQQLELYVHRIIADAQIKKGSRIYAHGISLAQTADILGISQWELMNYVGKTKISDFSLEKLNVIDRLNYTKKLFK